MTNRPDPIAILAQHESPDATFLGANPPLVFARAQGLTVWDHEGRRYLDLCAGFGVMSLGHHHPVHRAVFAEQATEAPAPVVHGMGDVYPSVVKAELIAQLVQQLPEKLDTVGLALSGGQAVEFAVKTALLRKSGVIAHVAGSYHGLDLGLLPLTDRDDFSRPFTFWQKPDVSLTIPWQASREVLAQLSDQLKQAGKDLSAVIVEPIQGRAGIKPAGSRWLEQLRQFADHHDALLIYDEVFCGLGRSGRWSFAELVPCDVVCLGKALGGGLPLSACVGSREVMASWPQNRGEALHTGTFFGHPLSCQMGLATLQAMIDQGLVDQAAQKGLFWLELLRSRLGSHPLIKDIRGEGLMLGLVGWQPQFGVRLMDELRALGVIALVSGTEGDILSLTPPLIIDQDTMEEANDLIGEALRRLTEGA
jgi:acetylornithine/succinyldiaminopimelate/putrescine aminotransferase